MPLSSPRTWPADDLRITHAQAGFLASGRTYHVSAAMVARTEDSLARRKMISWTVVGGKGRLLANAKGKAALVQHRHRLAANDNKREAISAA